MLRELYSVDNLCYTQGYPLIFDVFLRQNMKVFYLNVVLREMCGREGSKTKPTSVISNFISG